jgi:RHS repeat-associated protein
VPSAKIIGEDKFSIINDYIGRPVQVYSENGDVVWETDYDIYGDLQELKGDKNFLPFRQAGQYEDVETGLYYNRFRYYNPDTGLYLSQDPIRLAGNNPIFYAYTHDSNWWVDPSGLSECSFSKNFDSKLKKHANDIYQTARKLGIEIPKGDKEAMKSFVKSIADESSNLANSSSFKWNTIDNVNAYVKGDAVVLVDASNNEITTFLHKSRISSYLTDAMDLLK